MYSPLVSALYSLTRLEQLLDDPTSFFMWNVQYKYDITKTRNNNKNPFNLLFNNNFYAYTTVLQLHSVQSPAGGEDSKGATSHILCPSLITRLNQPPRLVTLRLTSSPFLKCQLLAGGGGREKQEENL